MVSGLQDDYSLDPRYCLGLHRGLRHCWGGQRCLESGIARLPSHALRLQRHPQVDRLEEVVSQQSSHRDVRGFHRAGTRGSSDMPPASS